MFPVFLITIFYGMASQSLSTALHNAPQAVPLPISLCCNLTAVPPEGDAGGRCVTGSHGLAAPQQAGPAQSHGGIFIGVHTPPKETETHTTVCFDILCWIEISPGEFVCNIEPSTEQSDIDVMVSECSQPGSNSTNGTLKESCRCIADDVIRCFANLSAVDHPISMAMNISSGRLTALSPVMSFFPQDLLKLESPVDLYYNVTIEGELLLSWTDSQDVAYPLVYDIRYSSNDSLDSWVHLDGETMHPVSLRNLGFGVTYTVQVRCRIPHIHGLWSTWSQPLYICLPEVTYLPKTMVASTGSNVTVYCIVHNWSVNARNAVWWLDTYKEVPEGQYSAVNDHVSRVTLFYLKPSKLHHTLQCCQRNGAKSSCGLSYATLYINDNDVLVSCETNGDLSAMTCSWTTRQTVTFQYQKSCLPCIMMEVSEHWTSVEECPLGGQGMKSCTFNPITPSGCYKIWLEFGKDMGLFKSPPIHVTPMDWVKPYPPYDLVASTLLEGYLNVEWKRHRLPVYELQFEMRYRADTPAAQWQVLTTEHDQSVVAPVPEPCDVYIVQVRCRRISGPGFWSSWSDANYSRVQNLKAPSQGPDFWRLFHDDLAWNQTNVTLLFLPLEKEEPLCLVEDFLVEHQDLTGQMWSERLGRAMLYTFTWKKTFHTITVMARNSKGSSVRNTKMTLVPPTEKIKSVSQFSVSRLNSSCVSLAWTLLATSPTPLSFVVEWRAQRATGGVKWVRVPTNSRTFNVYDNFLSSEDYDFILYPIFNESEGEAFFAKEDRGRSNEQHTAYKLLLITVLLSVGLFLALTLSQRQVMKLIWRDVPDPNNCSWAQDLDFKKAETVDKHFGCQERLSSCPLLLELETISEAVIMDKMRLPAEVSEMDGILDKTEKMAPVSPDIEDYQDLPVPKMCMMSTSVKSLTLSTAIYGSLLPSDEAALFCRSHKSIGSFSDEGNFSGNSDISEPTFWGPWAERLPSSGEAVYCQSYSFNSQDELSDILEPEDKALCGLAVDRERFGTGMIFGDQGREYELLRLATSAHVKERRELPPLESVPLCYQESGCDKVDPPVQDVPVYVPQFQTVSIMIPRVQTQECFSEA